MFSFAIFVASLSAISLAQTQPRATLTNSSVYFFTEASGTSVGYQTAEWKVPSAFDSITRGHHDFHVVFSSDKYGYAVARESATAPGKIALGAYLFATQGASPRTSGINCDLRSPSQVLHFDKAETGLPFAFKILEFRIDPEFDGQATRYLRVLIAENKQAFPLDLSRVPMAALLAGGSQDEASIQRQLKSIWVHSNSVTRGIKSIEVGAPRTRSGLQVWMSQQGLELRKHQKPVAVPATLFTAFSSFDPELVGKLNVSTVFPTDQEIQEAYHQRHLAEQSKLKDGIVPGIKIEDTSPAPQSVATLKHFKDFSIFKKSAEHDYYYGSEELLPYKRALKELYLSGETEHHELIQRTIEFSKSPSSGAELQALFEFLRTAPNEDFIKLVPKTAARLLDLNGVTQDNLPELFQEYEILGAEKNPFFLVTAYQDTIQFRYITPGLLPPLSSLTRPNASVACHLTWANRVAAKLN